MSDDGEPRETSATAAMVKFVLLCLAGFAIVASLIGTGFMMLLSLAAP